MTAINSNRAIRGPVTAVPVVAGKGVRLVADTENNRIVAEADETVLFYNASGAVSNTPINLSESIYNFERVRIDLCSKVHTNNWVSTVEVPIQYITNDYLNLCFTDRFDGGWQWITWRCGYPITNTGTTITLDTAAYGGVLIEGNWASGHNENTYFHLYKVVGINRVSASA